MICSLQFAKLLDTSAFPHVIAETPNRAAVNGGLTKAIREVKWSVPVEPMSTSASSPPNCPETIPLSGIPWKAGDPPNEVFQTFVPNVIHESDVKTVVPSGPIVTAGSLLPLSNNNAVFENVVVEAVFPRLPAVNDQKSHEKRPGQTHQPNNIDPQTKPPPPRHGRRQSPPHT